MVAPLRVPLDYPVYCEAGILEQLGRLVLEHAPAHSYVVITDNTVSALYGAQVMAQLPADQARLLAIPPGEHEKSRQRWAELTDAMSEWGAGRDTTVIAVGGGVIGDLAGFVAATYLRGVPVVQVPTTLLAMVDASIGGKTAIDTPYGKNLVGAFHDPKTVIMDPNLLRSLSPAMRRSGIAEIIKHGVIADASYFDATLHALSQLTALAAPPTDAAPTDAAPTDAAPTDAAPTASKLAPASALALPSDRGADAAAAAILSSLIAGSVRIKATVVAEDTREGGLRHILNFGHTIAHAIERELDYGIPHGEAVAIGMVIESRLAEHLGVAKPGLHTAVLDAVRLAGLAESVPAGITPAAMVAATKGDKKSRSGSVRYALPQGIGEMEAAEGKWSVAVPDDVILEILQTE